MDEISLKGKESESGLPEESGVPQVEPEGIIQGQTEKNLPPSPASDYPPHQSNLRYLPRCVTLPQAHVTCQAQAVGVSSGAQTSSIFRTDSGNQGAINRLVGS